MAATHFSKNPLIILNDKFVAQALCTIVQYIVHCNI